MSQRWASRARRTDRYVPAKRPITSSTANAITLRRTLPGVVPSSGKGTTHVPRTAVSTAPAALAANSATVARSLRRRARTGPGSRGGSSAVRVPTGCRPTSVAIPVTNYGAITAAVCEFRRSQRRLSSVACAETSGLSTTSSRPPPVTRCRPPLSSTYARSAASRSRRRPTRRRSSAPSRTWPRCRPGCSASSRRTRRRRTARSRRQRRRRARPSDTPRRRRARPSDTPLTGERRAEQVDGLDERGVGGGRVVALADVAREGVLGLVLAPAVARAGGVETGANGVAAGRVRVRVARAPDQQQLALDLTRPRERAGVEILAELAVVQTGRVPARGGAHARVEGGSEREVAAGAMARRAERRHAVAGLEVVQCRPHVLVEVRDRGGVGVGLSALLALVVEPEHRPGRLDAVVDLRHRDQEAVAREPHGPAQRRLGQLEDVCVEDDRGVGAVGARRRDERAHAALAHRYVDVCAAYDHYVVSIPPSTGSSAPVTYDDASLARKIAAATSSSGFPPLPAGTR